MAAGMEAKHDFGAGRFFNPQPLGADGHASVVADFEERAHAPDIIPPGTAGCRAQGGALFFFGVGPSAEWGLAQFTMHFMGVMMGAQGVNVLVGFWKVRNFFTGETGGQAALPELVFALDFTFGLRGGSVAQADVVEPERPAQLGQSLRSVSEKDTVVIDVKLQGASVGAKGGGQEVKVGEQQFAFVEFGAGEQTAAIIEHVEHGKGDFGLWEPTVGRGVELPEFADLGALPAAHGSPDTLGGKGVGQFVFDGPEANLRAIKLEGMEAQRFGSGKAVGRRRHGVESFVEQVQHGLRPRCGVVSAGRSRSPERVFFLTAGPKVSGGQDVEAAGGEAELFGRLSGADEMLPESVEHMPDEGGSVAVDQLLMFFKAGE